MQLYNTLTRKKETFTPRTPGKVSMYVCGITAYDYCHVGHARSSVVFDVLARYLRQHGNDVTFIRNFTDVDDKIINRANEVGGNPSDIAERFIQEFYVDMDALNIQRADVEPKCTEHIAEMVNLTKRLVDDGKAYATLSGDVYFRVRDKLDYGKLSGRDIDDLRAGARINPGEGKEDPLDFALWKAAKPGEPTWDSPWGPGQPGWHLECSAMAAKYVDLPLDIHGGGQDLIFPHHENEIAQTEAADGTDLATYWVHNGFVQINQEKMSKSLGNFFTIRDILKQFLPEVLRFFLLSQHYRSPLDFSFDGLEEAEKGLKRVYNAKEHLQEALQRQKWSGAALPADLIQELDDAENAYEAALADDLNTAGALGQVFTIVRLAGRVLEDKNQRKSQGGKELFERVLADLNTWEAVLGVFGQEPQAFLEALRAKRAERANIDMDAVDALLAKRAQARADKDFAASDTLRYELAGLGVQVKDTPAGQVWDVLRA